MSYNIFVKEMNEQMTWNSPGIQGIDSLIKEAGHEVLIDSIKTLETDLGSNTGYFQITVYGTLTKYLSLSTSFFFYICTLEKKYQ